MFPNVETSKRWDKSVKDLGFEILCVSQVSIIHIDGKENEKNCRFNSNNPLEVMKGLLDLN